MACDFELREKKAEVQGNDQPRDGKPIPNDIAKASDQNQLESIEQTTKQIGTSECFGEAANETN